MKGISYDFWAIAKNHEEEDTQFGFEPELLKEYNLSYDPSDNTLVIRNDIHSPQFGLVGKLISRPEILHYLLEKDGGSFKKFFGSEYLENYGDEQKEPIEIRTLGAGLMTMNYFFDKFGSVRVGEFTSVYFLDRNPIIKYIEKLE
jgi:hypothetical protein